MLTGSHPLTLICNSSYYFSLSHNFLVERLSLSLAKRSQFLCLEVFNLFVETSSFYLMKKLSFFQEKAHHIASQITSLLGGLIG
jgi:hypothetical protein